MRSDEKNAIESIIGQWPWREYPYKVGRWVYWERPTLLALLNDDTPGKKEWHRSMRTFLLCDPQTGDGIAEFDLTRAWWWSYRRLERYSGRVQFAGDPRLLGVLRSNTGPDSMRLVHAEGIDRATALSAARDLRPDRPVPAELLAAPAPRGQRAQRYTAPDSPERSTGRRSPDGVRRPWIADVPF